MLPMCNEETILGALHSLSLAHGAVSAVNTLGAPDHLSISKNTCCMRIICTRW